MGAQSPQDLNEKVFNLIVASSNSPELDEDVEKERRRVLDANSGDLVKTINLEKTFKDFKAVRGVSVGIRENECFGLLGVNGAGKVRHISFLCTELFY